MWVRNINPFFILLFLFPFFTSCKKESIELPWIELNTGSNATLCDLHFFNSEEGIIIGGNTWFEGVYLRTEDGGINWTNQSLGDKQLFGLDLNSNGIAYTVGIDGYLFSLAPDSTEWTFHRTPRFDILRDVAFNVQNNGIMVGGVAFSQGLIVRSDTNFTFQLIDTFAHQLNAVCFSEQEIVHAAGYGIVLRSTDAGLTWEENETAGDHFQAIHFPSKTFGYMVGINGTILKTTDGGINWDKIRNGDAVTVSDQAFQDVFFVDNDYGYIVGKGGLCWRTEDGGEEWKVVKGLPNVDFNAIEIVDGFVFLAGDEGRLIRIQD